MAENKEKKTKVLATINDLANIIVKITKTDRWVFIGCDGEMGEGKSCLTSQLAKAISQITKIPFSYTENMTYLRSELKTWVDGDKQGKNRKPEYSTILCDEIISMFFKRNWYDVDQIDGIELLNKCRDRHLCVIGNVPNFWDLDSAIYPVITFWIHIHKRGVAWVFQKDRNPFTSDKWHKKYNEKMFLKYKMPYRCKGFVCEIRFPDWTESEKQAYYNVRNVKRVRSEGQRKKESGNFKRTREQRDKLIRFIDLPTKDMATLIDMSIRNVRTIREEDIDEEKGEKR